MPQNIHEKKFLNNNEEEMLDISISINTIIKLQ